jgi:hypothetical protein
MKLFISHKHDDSAVYSMVCMALDSVNMDRFDPLSMRAGESLDLQLKVAIQECDVCLFLATSRSIESKWCLAELGAFWGAGKTVIMFMVDPDLTDTSLPPQFKGSLKANTAKDLIRSIQDHRQLKAQNPANLPPRFVRTRLMQQGYPHFSLTITDSTALMVSYFNSIEMGFGPLWQTEAGTQLYEYLAREFEHLWDKNKATESTPFHGNHD